MINDNPWTKKSSKIVYQNPWMTVHEDSVVTPEGNDGIYGYIETKDSVMVVALNDKKEIYLIRNFSYPAQSWNWELPGGGGEGEDPQLAAQRELVEETGIIARQWVLLGKTRVCNGLMTEQTISYLASDISFGDKPESDDTHLISHGQFFSLNQIHDMIQSGDINDGQSLTALYLTQQHLS